MCHLSREFKHSTHTFTQIRNFGNCNNIHDNYLQFAISRQYTDLNSHLLFFTEVSHLSLHNALMKYKSKYQINVYGHYNDE